MCRVVWVGGREGALWLPAGGICASQGTFSSYTPGIYADGYIVFAFPFVRSYVR